ncbi:MAG: hypothetical protein WCV92_00485 [Candidatus Buchananbacteria bacterium]
MTREPLSNGLGAAAASIREAELEPGPKGHDLARRIEVTKPKTFFPLTPTTLRDTNPQTQE